MPGTSPGPIASEVIEGVAAKLLSPQRPPLPIVPAPDAPPMPVSQTGTVSVSPAPNEAPFSVRDKAVPIFGTGAWWFQKGGPVGVICFLLIGSFWWMGNSQRESTGALIGNMQDQQKVQNEERKQIMTVLLTTQNEISSNMNKLARSIERLESRIDKK
jgi:hypothetical protein